ISVCSSLGESKGRGAGIVHLVKHHATQNRRIILLRLPNRRIAKLRRNKIISINRPTIIIPIKKKSKRKRITNNSHQKNNRKKKSKISNNRKRKRPRKQRKKTKIISETKKAKRKKKETKVSQTKIPRTKRRDRKSVV